MRRKRGRDVVFVADRVLLLLAIEEEVVVEDKIAVLVVVTPSTYFRVKSSVVRDPWTEGQHSPLVLLLGQTSDGLFSGIPLAGGQKLISSYMSLNTTSTNQTKMRNNKYE